MKIIVDQYTDRSDLTYAQKWRLRHPAASAASTKAWRQRNRERYNAYQSNYKRTHT